MNNLQWNKIATWAVMLLACVACWYKIITIFDMETLFYLYFGVNAVCCLLVSDIIGKLQNIGHRLAAYTVLFLLAAPAIIISLFVGIDAPSRFMAWVHDKIKPLD